MGSVVSGSVMENYLAGRKLFQREKPEEMKPSELWSLYRLKREQAGAPGSDQANYFRLMAEQEFNQKKEYLQQISSALKTAHETFKETKSIAGKQLQRQNMLNIIRQLPQRDQMLMSMYLPPDPEMARDFRLLEFHERYGTTKVVDPTWQEDAPGRWANDTWYNAKLDQLRAKIVDDQEVPLNPLMAVNEKYYAYEGKLIDKAAIDTTAKEIADKHNISVVALLGNGGYGPWETKTVASVDPQTKLPVGTLVKQRQNLLFPNEPMQIEKVQLGESQGPRQKIGERPPIRTVGGSNVDPVSALNAAFANDPLEVGSSSATRQLYTQAREAIEQYGTDLNSLRQWTMNAGSQLLDNYTLTIRPVKTQMEISQAPWANIIPFFPMTRLKDFYLVPTPGKPEYATTRDGKNFRLIIDRSEYGTVSTLDGMPINQFFNSQNPDDIIHKISQLTYEEFVNYGNKRSN